MKHILEANSTKSLNIQKPFIGFFGMNEAITLTLMMEKFINSIEQNRAFKMPKSEYGQFVTYHSFMKATDYFETIGLLRICEDVNGIQMGKTYLLNPTKLEKICEICLICSKKPDYLDYINEYVKDNFNINEIKQALK